MGAATVLTNPQLIKREEWQRFVDEHRRGTAFYRPEMIDVYTSTHGYSPVFTCAVDEQGRISGLMIGVLQRPWRSLVGSLASRTVVWGAPLVRNDCAKTLDALLRTNEQTTPRPRIYTEFRHLHDATWSMPSFDRAGYEYEEHYTVLLDLSEPEEIRWKRMTAFRRKNVKKALREGIAMREISEDDDISKTHEFVLGLYARLRLPSPPLSYFRGLAKHLRPPGLVRYFGAYHHDRLVASRIILCHRRWMYDLWAGGDESVSDLQATTALPWHIFNWGSAHGFVTFDFGGAGKPGVPYGVRDYKLAYGGELTTFGRHRRSRNRWLFRAGSGMVRLAMRTNRNARRSRDL